MKRCTNCIMPETVPNLVFDKRGVCNFCSSHKEEKLIGKEELDKIVKSAKEKNCKYDCIVPLSGGRDSTFVLYVAKAIYNMKVLAVNYDNGFRAEQAPINMKNACKALGVDFITIRSKIGLPKRIVRHSIRAIIPQGLYAILGTMCWMCTRGYKSVAYRTAEKYKVPLILWGDSPNESIGDMQKAAFGTQKYSRWRKYLNINAYIAEFYKLALRIEFHVPGNSIFSRGFPVLKNKNIQEVYLYRYIQWDRKKMKEILTKELNWRKPEGHASARRIDCMLYPLVNYSFFNLLGCTKDGFGYCNMINSGQISRAEALAQEEQAIATISENIRSLLEDEIGLSKKESARIESLAKQIQIIPNELKRTKSGRQ